MIMTNLIRKKQNIFCNNNQNDLSVFGSRKQGQPTQSADVETLQSENYNQGWEGAVIANNCPTMEDFNTLNYINTYQLSYLFQKGIAEWNKDTTYYKGNICMVIIEDKPVLYYSKIDSNINNNPQNDIVNWEQLQLGGNGGGLPLLTTIWSDHLLNDTSYLRSDTFSWQSGDIYIATYNKLVEEKNSANKIGQYEPIVLPTFTSNTQDGITISDSRDNTTILQAIFNGTNNSNTIGIWSNYWININYGRLTKINSYILQADNLGEPEYPTAWTLQGYNGTDWEVIDTQENIVFSLNELKTFNINTENYYTQYRIVFNAGITTSESGELKKVSFNVDDVVFYYYKSTNGFNIVDPSQQQNIIDLFNNTGIAWFYILDEENKQFKLPRTKYNFVGYRNNVGGYVEAGLPDHTHTYEMKAVTGGSDAGGDIKNIGLADYQTGLASESNSIYGNSDTVQPPATEMYLYFYVGNTVRNQTEIDVGTITEELNNKVDTDLSNISENGKQVLKNTFIAFPDYNAGVSFSIPSSGNTFTVEYDCLLYIADRSAIAGMIILKNNDINGTEILGMGASDANTYTCANIFLKKGQVVYVQNTKNNLICVMYPLI